MSLKEQKLEIVDRVIHTNDQSVIRKLRKVLDEADKDFWDELPVEIKKAIGKSIDQADRGEVLTHQVAMKRLKKWRTK